MSEPQLTRANILAETRRVHARLEQLVASMDDAQLTRPGLYSTWSVKDCLAHLADWHRLQTYWLTTALRGTEPALPCPGYTWDDMDRLNADWHALSKDRPLAAVLADYQTAYAGAVAAIEGMSDEQIDTPYYAWTKGRPLAGLVAADSFEHEQEFVEAIEHWLTANKSLSLGQNGKNDR